MTLIQHLTLSFYVFATVLPISAHLICAATLPETIDNAIKSQIGSLAAVVLMILFVFSKCMHPSYLAYVTLHSSLIALYQFHSWDFPWQATIILALPVYISVHTFIYNMLRIAYEPTDLGVFGMIPSLIAKHSEALWKGEDRSSESDVVSSPPPYDQWDINSERDPLKIV